MGLDVYGKKTWFRAAFWGPSLRNQMFEAMLANTFFRMQTCRTNCWKPGLRDKPFEAKPLGQVCWNKAPLGDFSKLSFRGADFEIMHANRFFGNTLPICFFGRQGLLNNMRKSTRPGRMLRSETCETNSLKPCLRVKVCEARLANPWLRDKPFKTTYRDDMKSGNAWNHARTQNL